MLNNLKNNISPVLEKEFKEINQFRTKFLKKNLTKTTPDNTLPSNHIVNTSDIFTLTPDSAKKIGIAYQQIKCPDVQTLKLLTGTPDFLFENELTTEDERFKVLPDINLKENRTSQNLCTVLKAYVYGNSNDAQVYEEMLNRFIFPMTLQHYGSKEQSLTIKENTSFVIDSGDTVSLSFKSVTLEKNASLVCAHTHVHFQTEQMTQLDHTSLNNGIVVIGTHGGNGGNGGNGAAGANGGNGGSDINKKLGGNGTEGADGSPGTEGGNSSECTFYIKKLTGDTPFGSYGGNGGNGGSGGDGGDGEDSKSCTDGGNGGNGAKGGNGGNGGKSGNGANIVIYIDEGVEYILTGTHDVSPGSGGHGGNGGAAGKGGSKKSDGKPGSPGTSGSAGISGSAGQAGQSGNISILPYRDPVD